MSVPEQKMSWSRKELGKYDFELFITQGVEFGEVSFPDLEAAREYFVPGLKKAKKILRARTDKIERHTNFISSNLSSHTITSGTVILSLKTMHELKHLRNLINDEHPTKENAEAVAVAIRKLELDADSYIWMSRMFIVFVILMRASFFTLTFYLLMILPAFIGHGGSLMSPTRDFSTLFLRSLPFIIGVCWEVIGEFIKPLQIEAREEETMLIRIKRTASAMRKILSCIAPYLELGADSLA